MHLSPLTRAGRVLSVVSNLEVHQPPGPEPAVFQAEPPASRLSRGAFFGGPFRPRGAARYLLRGCKLGEEVLMPFLVHILVVLLIAGLVLWGVSAAPFIDAGIKQIIRIVLIIAVVIYLLQASGLLSGHLRI
jgi:hypothetical protein